MTFTVAIDRSEYLRRLVPAIEETSQLIASNHIAFQNTITERALTAFRQIQDTHGVSRIAQSMLLEAAYRSEKVGANSADLTLLFAISLVKELTKSIDSGKDIRLMRVEVDECLARLRERLEHRSNPVSRGNLWAATRAAVKNDRLSDMVLESANLAGIDGRILPTHSLAGYSVELVQGYTFDAASYPSFYNQSGRWETENVRVLIVDGVIERESEVHQILTQAVQKKIPLLIVARGYGEEVVSTLGANKARGLLRVLPIRIPFEIESINIVTDIAVVSGVTPVTPLKGDIVSTVKLEDLPEIDSVTATAAGSLTISNKKTKKAVGDHAQMLQKRRDEQNVEQMSEVLNKRIRSMFANCVHLRIAGRTEQQKIHELEAVDYGLRTIKSVLAHGTDVVSEIPKLVSRGTLEFNQSLNVFRDIDEIRPTMSIFSALHHGISVAFTLASIEKAILLFDGSSSGDGIN